MDENYIDNNVNIDTTSNIENGELQYEDISSDISSTVNSDELSNTVILDTTFEDYMKGRNILNTNIEDYTIVEMLLVLIFLVSFLRLILNR